MKISIITISFNQARYLKRCIDSILMQEIDEFEYIVVDPGSTDGSREIIDSYGSRIVRVYEKDSGAADGLNRGFARATGDILGFINSDDELLPNALKAVLEGFKKNRKADVLSGCGYFIDSENNVLRKIVPSIFSPWLYAHGAVSIFQQGTFFRSTCYKNVGGFNLQNRTCWDGELFLDMALAGAKFITIGSDLAVFRLHSEGITGSGRLEEAYQRDQERLFQKITGRKRKWSDSYTDVLARMVKFGSDPLYIYRKVAGIANFPRRVT